MKISNKLRDKRILSALVVTIAILICVITALSLMLPSWLSYKEYYDAAVAEREEQKRLNALPLELLGISAELADGVTYYDNGRAHPETEDFSVTAHFTEKGKAFDEKLRANDFDISVPDGFTEKGGVVTVSYTWTPEATDDAEEPVSVTRTATVNITLEGMRLESLRITDMPYRIYYSDDMAFAPEGMRAEAVYNDGSAVTVPVSALQVESMGPLAAGTTSVSVSYSDGKDEVQASVPVKVDTEDVYDDGNVISMEPVGKVYLQEGELLSAAKPVVRATYMSGNRLLLGESRYEVTGNVETASFMKNCVLTVSLKDSDVFFRTAAAVQKGVEAEDGDVVTAAGGTLREVSAYEETDGGLTETGSATVLEGMSRLSFKVNSAEVAKPQFGLRLANLNASADGEEILPLALSEAIVSVKVNGREIPVSDAAELSGHAAVPGYVFEDAEFPAALLKEGSNTVEIEFAENAKVAVDRISFFTEFEGEFYASMDDYFARNAESGGAASVSASRLGKFGHDQGNYAHSICTDGEYLYAAFTWWSNERSVQIEKIDPDTGSVLASVSTGVPVAVGDNATILYYDGQLIIPVDRTLREEAGGVMLAMNVEDFGNGGKFEPAEPFVFAGLENETLKDVYYNAARKQFAVFVGLNVFLFNEDGSSVDSFAPATDSAGTVARMTASEEYIYVNYSARGKANPVLGVYDWDGNYVGRLEVSAGSAAISAPNPDGFADFATADKQTQGIAFLDNVFYYTVCAYVPGNDMSAIIKAEMPEIEENRTLELGLGEYIAACEDSDRKASYETSPVQGSYGRVDVDYGYACGAVSDGTYVYVARQNWWSSDREILKLDPSNGWSKVASNTVTGGVPGSNDARLMIKDGLLYCFISTPEGTNRTFAISLDNFTAEPTETTLSFSGQTEGLMKGATWSEYLNSYAAFDENGLYVFSADGTKKAQTAFGSGNTASSIMSDDSYIYVSFRADWQSEIPVNVYDWSGNLVATASLPVGNVDAGYSYNVQTLMMHGGRLYAVYSVNDPADGGNGKGIYIFEVEKDMSVIIEEPEPQKELIGDRVAAGEGWSIGNAAAGSSGAADGTVWGSEKYWGYTKGGVSDGRYMYIVSYNNWNARIIKLDGTSAIAASAQFSVGSEADLTRLMIKDGTLYCFINNGAVKTFDLNTFAEGCTPTDGTLPFGEVPGVVRDAEWNAEDRTYAVLDMEGNLYILSEDGEILTTNTKVASAGSRGWFEANSITSDERYVYVSLKYNQQDVIAVLVYDWDGNYIGEQVSYVNFNISVNYNIQSVFMHGDELYFTLWVDGSGSIHLWKLYMMN